MASTAGDRDDLRTLGVYAALLAGYVVLGYFTKSLVLNWIVGPLFPLIVLYVIPRAWTRLTGGDRRR